MAAKIDLTKIVKKKGVDGKDYYTDDTNYYTEYTLTSPRDKGIGLMEVARRNLDRKGGTPDYMQILRLASGKVVEISNKSSINMGETFLVPALAPVVPPPPPDVFTLTSERHVRSAHVKDGNDANVIYTPKADPTTKFKYNTSSVYLDAGGLVWAEVDLISPNNKDKAGTVWSKGWICVKNGTTYYTDPHIDPPKPDLG